MMQLEVEQIAQTRTEHCTKINYWGRWGTVPLGSVNSSLGNNVVINATALPPGRGYKGSMLMLLYPQLKQAVDFLKWKRRL